jgi:hypothetical protein
VFLFRLSIAKGTGDYWNIIPSPHEVPMKVIPADLHGQRHEVLAQVCSRFKPTPTIHALDAAKRVLSKFSSSEQGALKSFNISTSM